MKPDETVVTSLVDMGWPQAGIGVESVVFTSHLRASRGPETMQRTDTQPSRHPPPAARHPRRAIVLIILAVAAAGVYLAYDQYRLFRLGRTVRRGFAARRFEEARDPLQRWLRAQPRSAEARYYEAWLALADQQPRHAVEAMEQARKLGCDLVLLAPLAGIVRARAGQVNDAEPVLRQALLQKREPQTEVARELALIYLSTYRLLEAAEVIERWKALAPQDPHPYLWSNEIASRSDTEPSVQIRNYRAALERDPNLDQARLGLAEQLSRDRRFDEAKQEYHAYLERNPRDATALVGLGRNAFQNGDLDGATRSFEAALAVDPHNPEALKELALADLRVGRFARACQRFEILTRIEPYDHEIRYTYAQALRAKGDAALARSQAEMAARLRQEHDHVLQLRDKLLKDPSDQESRFEVARWMLEHGHAEEGLRWTKEILRADPRHAPTHRALADYYDKQGDAGLANYHRLRASLESE
jgi:tetratricopeptide (TPR) repeat protein